MRRLICCYGNPGGLHAEGVEAQKELRRARRSIAASIGAHEDEIVFVGSGTEANNLAIQGVIRPLLREHGEVHAITSAIEHPSVLNVLRALEREGLYVTELPVDREGRVSPEDFAQALNEQTVFVSVQLVNSEIGTIEPLKALVKEVRKERARRGTDESALPLFIHSDASQAPLWMPLMVDSLGVDLLTLDAQKILGPKGIGVLFVRRNTPVEPLLWGGNQEGGMRGGTENVLLSGAMAVALADALAGAAARAPRVAAARDMLYQKIRQDIPDVLLNGPSLEGNARVANNLNISIPGLDAETAVIALDALGVAVSTRSACSAGEEEPSHVIRAIGTPEELAGTALRLTLLPDITTREVSHIARALRQVAKLYRNVV